MRACVACVRVHTDCTYTCIPGCADASQNEIDAEVVPLGFPKGSTCAVGKAEGLCDASEAAKFGLNNAKLCAKTCDLCTTTLAAAQNTALDSAAASQFVSQGEAAQFRAQGNAAEQARAAGFSASDLCHAGCPIPDIVRAGHRAKELFESTDQGGLHGHHPEKSRRQRQQRLRAVPGQVPSS